MGAQLFKTEINDGIIKNYSFTEFDSGIKCLTITTFREVDYLKYTNSEYRISDNLARREKSRYILNIKELEDYIMKGYACFDSQNKNQIYVYWIPNTLLV